MEYTLSFTDSLSKESHLKCVVKVTKSMYKTSRGYALKVELTDMKRKSGLSMSDMFCEEYEIGWIENLHDVDDGVYDLVPASWDYGTYEYPRQDVESWMLVPLMNQ